MFSDMAQCLSNLTLSYHVPCSPKVQPYQSFAAPKTLCSFLIHMLPHSSLCLICTFLSPPIIYVWGGLPYSPKLKSFFFFFFFFLFSITSCLIFPHFLLNILYLFIIKFNFQKTGFPWKHKLNFISLPSDMHCIALCLEQRKTPINVCE